MNYQDFQILDSEQYKIMRNYYNQAIFSRKDMVAELYENIKNCLPSSLQINKLNSSLKKQIKLCQTTLEQILENINANFSIIKTNKNSFQEVNLFTFIKKLISLLNITNKWLYNEDKPFYKNFINNINQNLIFIISNILSGLENSNVILFKYM